MTGTMQSDCLAGAGNNSAGAAPAKRARVCLVQRVLPHYRMPFLLRARQTLLEAGCDLTVCYGSARAGERPQSVPDPGLDWIEQHRNTYVPLFGAVWQRLPRSVLSADLVVIEQANRLLVNYFLIARRAMGCKPGKLAYWTHGRNWQRSPSSLRERWKRLFTRRVDYWFCYTDSVADYLDGVPGDRKCSVDNAIDTAGLRLAIEKAAAAGVVKDDLNLLFLGSMREEKRVDWVLDAVAAARSQHRDVTAAFIGDGPETAKVQRFCATNPWARYLGPLYGNDVAPHLLRASAILMPGPVGLVILDSFVGGAPLITTRCGNRHGPEFSYATAGCNALVTADDPAEYIRGVMSFVSDPELRSRLREGCAASASRYTVENMAGRFAAGVRQALRND